MLKKTIYDTIQWYEGERKVKKNESVQTAMKSRAEKRRRRTMLSYEVRYQKLEPLFLPPPFHDRTRCQCGK